VFFQNVFVMWNRLISERRLAIILMRLFRPRNCLPQKSRLDTQVRVRTLSRLTPKD